MEEEYYYEEFRVIPGFPDYQVSDMGRIWSNNIKMYLNGTKNDGYIVVKLYHKCVEHVKRIHVLIASAFLENPESKPLVDHKNGDRSDNILSNLRYATLSENGQNRKVPSNNKSGVKGVSFNKQTGKWQAYIQIDGIKVHLGLFKTIEEAQKARVAKANEVFGVYTHSFSIIYSKYIQFE